MSFLIKWEDVRESSDYDNPLEAVKSCLEAIQNEETLAFTVEDTITGKQYRVSLDDGEEIVEEI